mmetsp:Transcript_52868/g.172041  ORF Transcript_52868/g.172041 Transcript_52868/m.172041 type:complete len:201 (-) Transcript_52868:371-973(-)
MWSASPRWRGPMQGAGGGRSALSAAHDHRRRRWQIWKTIGCGSAVSCPRGFDLWTAYATNGIDRPSGADHCPRRPRAPRSSSRCTRVWWRRTTPSAAKWLQCWVDIGWQAWWLDWPRRPTCCSDEPRRPPKRRSSGSRSCGACASSGKMGCLWRMPTTWPCRGRPLSLRATRTWPSSSSARRCKCCKRLGKLRRSWKSIS